MGVLELVHQVNERLNNGDEGKLPVTFAIVNEILVVLKEMYNTLDIDSIITIVWAGMFDQFIVDLTEELNDENELKMLGNVHKFFLTYRNS